MDLVYMVRRGDKNEDLKMSLRSIDKFAPSFDNVRIFGYKPTWINDSVKYVPTRQLDRIGKWKNCQTNLLAVCSDPSVSENFILMNDDFILTRPIQDWNESLNKVKNTFEEQIEEYKRVGPDTGYTRFFSESLDFTKKISGKNIVMNFELHIPMIFNKTKLLNMLEMEEIKSFMKDNWVMFYRSLYGNIYTDIKETMKDVKIYPATEDSDKFDTEWISVDDNIIGWESWAPKLNKYLNNLFPNKSRFEN